MSMPTGPDETKSGNLFPFQILQFLLIALPVISLIFNAISLLRFGVDMPYWDDWRQYHEGSMGRIDLSYLMAPANDTLYPVGLLLDSLAFRFLDGNTVAYQFISMIFILGSLLILQWRLLSICTTNNMIRACVFSLTLFMLQPDTYWGLQNMAYHQAVPLVCILGILALTFGKLRMRFAAPGFLFLSFISGFTYISGAFAVLSLCTCLLICHFFSEGANRKRMQIAGISLIPAAVICTAMQIWVIVGVQHGTHLAGVSMAYPWESDFWLFLLGKVARSLILPTTMPTLSLSLTVLIMVITLACVASALIKALKSKSNTISTNTVIFISLSAIIFVYLLLIAAGRTNIRSELTQATLDIFVFGFERFHFFWVTLLWPWLALYIIQHNKNKASSNLRIKSTAVLFVLFTSLLIFTTPALNHSDYYKSHMLSRLNGVKCLQTKIQNGGSLNCQDLFPYDLSQAVKNAKRADASFTRPLVYMPVAFESKAPIAFYKTTGSLPDIKPFNASIKNQSNTAITLETQADSQIYFSTGMPALMQQCRTLEVTARIKVSGPQIGQLYFLPINDPILSESNSKKTEIDRSDDFQTISFIVTSTSGFKDSLRLDPVMDSQTILIEGIETRCREKQ